MKKLLYLLFALVLSCSNPSQHDPRRYGTVTVWIAPTWSALDRAQILEQLGHMNALGPAFVTTDDVFTARVTVYPFVSEDCRRTGAGRWTVGTRRIEVDRVCVTSDVAFRTAIGHEIGHAIGMRHICVHDEKLTCSPVGRGMAMMNPSLFEGDELTELPQATDVPTELDLAEYLRTRGADLDAGVPTD